MKLLIHPLFVPAFLLAIICFNPSTQLSTDLVRSKK